jgi:hypothetical protein
MNNKGTTILLRVQLVTLIPIPISTNSIQLGPEHSLHFMKPQGSSLCSQEHVLATILGQMNLVHTLPFYAFQTNFNIILPLYFTLADIK